MAYRKWKLRELNRAAAVALAQGYAGLETERQLQRLLEQNPQAVVPAAERQRYQAQQQKESALLAGVLAARGVQSPAEMLAFLEPPTEMSDPYLLRDMDKAVARIREALNAAQTIVVYGDYDVDGVTATALLYEYLKTTGANVKCMLPSRSGDGYGLSAKAVDSMHRAGASLIVTVDNGISAHDQVAYAASLGMDVVITDHHLPPEALPPAVAIVDPQRRDDTSPFKGFSGAGVAFLLCAALEECGPTEMLEYCGDLACIGTVADVMPLTGENRILVRGGLRQLCNTERPGLLALLEVAGLENKPLTAENISFGLAPRINAAGRMDSAVTALQLILSEDKARADELAQRLTQINAQRQAVEQQITQAALEQLTAHAERLRDRVLLVWGEGWHQGVLGIVASRLVDRTGKPAIVLSVDGAECKGSGRSVAGFNLYAALEACEGCLLRYGGHDQAAGLSLQAARLEEFRSALNRWATREYPLLQQPELEIDLSIKLEHIGVENVRGLEKMAPFGNGNESPVFLLEAAEVLGVYPVSEGRHTRLRLRQGGGSLYAVCFGQNPTEFAYPPGSRVDVVLSLSVYDGRAGAQLSGRVLDIRPAGLGNAAAEQRALFASFQCGACLSAEQLQQLTPARQEIAAVYRLVQKEAFSSADLQPLFARLAPLPAGKILCAITALEQLGLLAERNAEGKAFFAVLPAQDKRDLAAAPILQSLEAAHHGN